MSVINKDCFENWILSSLSTKSSRHLFFDFNERLIRNILSLYSSNGSVIFLKGCNFWVFSQTQSDPNYLSKDRVTRINDSDLIEVRNSSLDNSFVVLVSNLAPVIIPSDNITSVSERYYESQKKYIEYICSVYFVGTFNFEEKIITELKAYLYTECFDNLDYCFYKAIDLAKIYDFFGLIGEEKHFNTNSLKESIYFKGFIQRVQYVLESESYGGLENRLAKSNVTNYKEAVLAFKREGYISAKEFSRNICNVFLRETEKYRLLINVDEWIYALIDEIEEDTIQYEGKKQEDVFNIVKVGRASSDKRSYIIRLDVLQLHLASLRTSIWTIDRQEQGQLISLNVLQKDKLLNIVSKLQQEKKSISVINYSNIISEDSNLDFALRINERYDEGKNLKITVKRDLKLIEEIRGNLKNIIANIDDCTGFDANEINNASLNIYEVKDKTLFANSDLNLSIRLIDKETKVEFVLLEDENYEFKINCESKSQIESKSILSNFNFKDIEFYLQNISLNRLFVKISNAGDSEWIVIQFSPLGVKEPIVVKNYFQKYQALNDSFLKNRVISIESKLKNDIHYYYFEDKFDFHQTYLPTIFNFENDYSLVSDKDTNPYFLDKKKYRLDTDFRPSKQSFDDLNLLEEFQKYLECRALINLWYRNKFTTYDIRSIDDIDFSTDDIYCLSEEYLLLYNKILSINECAIWLDTFYFCKVNASFNRLENMPYAVFLSPYNPILIFQLTSKMKLMRNTVEKIKRPNSISSLLKRNILECWVLNVPTQQECFFSIDTDSTLFTGFVSEKDIYVNTLEPTLRRFGVSFSQGIGHLSSGQIKSALNKSYSYLSNKSTFNIKLEGKLVDNSSNDSILEWVEMKTMELNKLYRNFNLQINIFDNRETICYPSDNLLSFYKDEKKLNFNWYKGVSGMSSFDLTLITSFIPDTSTYNQSNPDYFSNSFSCKNLITTSLSIYQSSAVYKDIFFNNSEGDDEFNCLIKLVNSQFKRNISINQTRTLLKNSSFNDSEVVAISSDVSNSYILEEVVGKTLWEFSISDYSYEDNGKGDYFLIANEQEVYVSNFQRFLREIDPDSDSKFHEILNYSKRTGLFELKHLISNQNFIKGFIASVAARKVIDNIICDSSDTFIVPYDVFKSRFNKIKLEVHSNYKEIGTQYPDFVLIQMSKENDAWFFDIRLIEIKYRNILLGEVDIAEILSNQTNSVKEILCTLNSWRYENLSEYGLWVDTLSILLTEMSQFYFNNTLNFNSALKRNFAEAINGNYNCRINDSLLIALDCSSSIVSGSAGCGFYLKIPQTHLHVIFSNNEEVNNAFKQFFHSLIRRDSCSFNLNQTSNDNDTDSFKNSEDAICTDLNDSDSDDNILEVNESETSNIFKQDEPKIITEIKSISLNVMFGRDGANRDVVYYPKGKGIVPLPNYNIMVTGSSGKGKTQFIKSFIFQQGRNDTSFTIIDFKNDYSDTEFCEQSNLKKISVKLQGIPYNPLIPRLVVDEDSGQKYYDISEHINGICSVLRSTFGLGDQQEAQLKKAVREVFKLSGVESKGTLEYTEGMTFPTFNEVGDFINSGDKQLVNLYNRLDPLFDLNLFPDKYKNVGFENVINGSLVIKVSDIQNDKVKNAIAKMLVVSAHSYYLSSEHKSIVSKYFVFDEAHRILDSEFVEKFIRECRAFGVGVLLSSQQPDDFPDEVLGQLATKVIHGNEGIAKQIKKIKGLISFGQDERFIKNLQTFEAIVNNQDYNNFIITTLAWPHLMILEVIRDFPFGVSFDDLNGELLKRGIKDSELNNLLYTLESKKYISSDMGIYRVLN